MCFGWSRFTASQIERPPGNQESKIASATTSKGPSSSTSSRTPFDAQPSEGLLRQGLWASSRADCRAIAGTPAAPSLPSGGPGRPFPLAPQTLNQRRPAAISCPNSSSRVLDKGPGPIPLAFRHGPPKVSRENPTRLAQERLRRPEGQVRHGDPGEARVSGDQDHHWGYAADVGQMFGF